MGAQSTTATTVDFGAFPGKTDTSLAVTGQAAIVAESLVEAWILPRATSDHTADEHWVEDIVVMAGSVVAGTGFTIYARVAVLPNAQIAQRLVSMDRVVGPGTGSNQPRGTDSPRPTRLYGLYTVGWVWN